MIPKTFQRPYIDPAHPMMVIRPWSIDYSSSSLNTSTAIIKRGYESGEIKMIDQYESKNILYNNTFVCKVWSYPLHLQGTEWQSDLSTEVLSY